MKKFIYLIIFLCSIKSVQSQQVQSLCPSTDRNFSVTLPLSEYVEWRVFSRNTGQELNGQVATINGDRNGWGQKNRQFNNATIRFDDTPNGRNEFIIEFKKFGDGFLGFGYAF